MCVFFIPWRSRGKKQWVVTSISHMGEILDSDWSRDILLRSDWLLPRVAPLTTNRINLPLSYQAAIESLDPNIQESDI